MNGEDGTAGTINSWEKYRSYHDSSSVTGGQIVECSACLHLNLPIREELH